MQHSMLGNPWNPMPGWLFPGLHDEPMAPFNTLWNRGAFDAVGLPYAFAHQDGEILRRVYRTNGEPGFTIQYFLDLVVESYGPEALPSAYGYLNDQFAHMRNRSFPQPPPPFWTSSPQVHVMYRSEKWILIANANRPPGAIEGSPPDGFEWQPGMRPIMGFGNDLKRWSLYDASYPQFDAFDDPKPYDLWQTYLDGTAESLPADQPRAGAFPFPELVLWGVTGGFMGGVWGTRVALTPYNP
jgi:hypothetical protein